MTPDQPLNNLNEPAVAVISSPLPPPRKSPRPLIRWVIFAIITLIVLSIGTYAAVNYVRNRGHTVAPVGPTPTPSLQPAISSSERSKLKDVTPGASQLDVTALTAQTGDIDQLLVRALQVANNISVQGNLTGTGNATFGGSLVAAALSGNGAGITNVNAALLGGQSRTYYENLATGATSGLANLVANAAIKNAANTFTAANTFNSSLTVAGLTTLGTTNISSLILGSPLTVDQGGTGLTSIPAQGIVYGQGGPTMAVVTPGSAGQCLLSGATDIQWGSCPGGGGGVASLNGQTGSVVIAGASGSGGTITLGDATAGTKGIASFNVANFSVTAGAVNTIQDIAPTSAPTFGGLTLSSALSVTSGGTGATNFTSNGVVIGAGSGVLTTVTAGGAGLCLISNVGAPSFQACPGGGAVTSVNGQTGALTIANASGSAGTITVDDASTAQKGIASFNPTNFTAAAGAINTIQNIATGSSPTFAGINTNSIAPTAALTVGATAQNLTLQGANTTITATNGASVAQLTFIAPTANVTYRLQTAAAGTYDVCTTAGNCVGVGGSVSTSGGSANVIPKYTSASGIGPSLLTDNGTLVTVGGNLSVTGTSSFTGALTLTAALTVGNGGTGATSAGAARTNLGAAASGANADITSLSGLTTALSIVQGGTGAVALTANGVLLGNGTSPISAVTGTTGQCLVATTGSAPSFQTCTGAGGVSSLNGQTGAVTIANASGSAGTVTIQDASTSQKGIAQFNGTNFSASAGTVNTIQNIDATASPTFAGVNTNSITPSSSLAIGSTSQSLTLQGTTATITSTNGANLAQLTFVAPTANVTYRLQTAAAGTYDICTTASNCVGVGGSVSTSGGSANVIPKYTSASAIGPSLLTDNGTLVTVGGNASVTGTLAVTGAVTLTTALTVGNGGTGATSAGAARTNLGAAASGANADITSLSGLTTALSVAQGGTGAVSLTANGVLLGGGTSAITSLVAGGSGLCLVSTAGAPAFSACPGSGGSVTSLNGLTGVLTVANASGSGGTVTIDDASTAAKGIAQFNATNFSASGGTVNTIQNINTGASPTFAGVNTNTITPSAALTVGATAQAFTIQGNASSVFTSTNSGNVTTVGFATPTANTTLNFPASAAGSYTICTTVGNCSGTGGGVTTPGGTTGALAKFTGAQTLADSIISESAGVITVAGGQVVQGSTGLTLGTGSGNNGQIVFNNSTNGNTLTLQSGATGSNLTLTLPVADGSAGDCLTTNASGVLSFTPCLSGSGGGSGGVTSLNGLSGVLSVANASGSGATITINDASTAAKGIAQFNATNFQAASGTINTIQNIDTAATPSFSALTITSATGITVGTGSNLGQLALRDGSSAFNVKFQPSTQSANHTITVPNASGTLAVSASGNIALDAVGNLTFTGLLPIANGGTNANNATTARSNLGAAASGANADITSTTALNTITPSSALSIGSTGQALTLQGSTTTITATNAGNLAQLTFVSPTANVTYQLQTAAAGTYDVCTTAGNCVGTGGSVSTSGGSANVIPKYTSSSAIGPSLLTDNGTLVTVGGNASVTGTLAVTGAVTLTTALTVANGGTGAGTFTSNGVIVGNGTGTLAVTAAGSTGQCLLGNTGSAPSFGSCPGSGGVSSLNSQTGAVTLANASGSGGTVTINDATTAAKGIASFNSTNFSVTAGAVNTIQGIATTSSPTFAAGTFTAAGSLTLGTSGGGGNVGSATFRDGSSAFGATLNTTTLTANRTISLPNEAGTLCIQSSTNCGFAAATGSGSYIQNGTSMQTANFYIQSAAAGSIGAIVQGASGQTADIFRVMSNGSVVNLAIKADGSAEFIPTTDSTNIFNVKSATGNNTLTVDTTNARVGIALAGAATPALAGSAHGLEINGALRLSGGGGTTHGDEYVSPGGTNINTKINIPNYDPGSFGQLIAMGLPAIAQSTSRALSLFDARTVAHQPTLAVFNPTETDAVGFSWDGSATIANLKTLAGDLVVTAGTKTVLRANANGTVGVGDSAANYNPLALLTVTDSVPAASATGGALGDDGLYVASGNGGANTGSGFYGGAGGNITLKGGNGGDAVSGSSNGAGGNLLLAGGAPGAGAGTAGTPGKVVVRNNTNATQAFQVQNASSNSILNVNTNLGIVSFGENSTVTGHISFANSTNANEIHIQSPSTLAANYTLTLPATDGNSGDCLVDTTGSGVLGFTSCTGGVTGVNLQATTPGVQQTGNLNISGTAIAATAVQTAAVATSSVDTTSGGLDIGTVNATSIDLGKASQNLNLPGIINATANLQINSTFTTASNYRLSVAGTLNSSATGSQYGIANQVDFNPSGASLTAAYGFVNTASLAGSALTVTSFSAATSGLKTAAGFTGSVTSGYGTNILGPDLLGAGRIATYHGLQVGTNSANGGNTSGTITNYQLKVGNISAGSGTGGTVDNYGAHITVPNATGTGTTNNYGLYLNGTGGGSNAWSLYNNSASDSYFNGNVLINTTTNPNSYAVNISGDLAASAGLVSPSLTATTGALTLDTAPSAGVTINVGVANADNINLGRPTGTNVITTVNGVSIFKPNATHDSATAFQVQNGAGNAIATVDTSSSQLVLGKASTIAGKMLFNNATNANTVGVLSGVTSTSYNLTLPTAVGSSGDCLKDTTGAGVLGFAACGGGSGVTTVGSFSGSSQTNGANITGTTITFGPADATNPGMVTTGTQTLAGAKTLTGNTTFTGTLLQRSDSASAFILQDSTGAFNNLSFDSSTNHLKVYDHTAPRTAYADISYSGGVATFAASSGTTQIGGGAGDVNVTLVNNGEKFNFSHTGTTAIAGVKDFVITRTITGGSANLQGNVLEVADNSTTSGTNSPNLLYINQNNAAATGNLILAQTAGSTTKFQVATTGTVTIAAGQSYTSLGALTVASAAATALTLTGNAASTWSTSGSNALTINAGGALNLATANSSSVTIGNSTTNTPVTINSGTGTIAIGTGSQNRTIQIGTAGGGIQTVQIGSNNSTSSLLLQSGSGALNIQSQGGGITIGTNAVSQAITIGNTTGGALRVGQNAGTLQIDGTNFDLATTGQITVVGGLSPDFTTAVTASAGAALTIAPGTSTGASTNGAAASYKGGDASGTTSVTGGTVTLQGGNATGASGTRTGGNTVVDAGTGATANGSVSIGVSNAIGVTIGNATTGTAVNINSGTGGINLTGNFISKPLTNSTTAFLMQNAAGTAYFTADSTGLQIVIGSSGNTVTISAAGGVVAAGTARHTQRILLTPEYAGGSLDSAGDTGGANCATNNNGTMTSGFAAGISGFGNLTQSYYKWTTAAGSNQCYDVVVQVPVPSDFSAWASSTPVSLNAFTSNTTNGLLNLEARDTAGTVETSCNYVNVTPGSTSTWATNTAACTIGGTYTAGGYMTLRIRMTSPASGDVRLGNIALDYLSRY